MKTRILTVFVLISSDLESISKEVAGIDTNASENTIKPLTEADLTID